MQDNINQSTSSTLSSGVAPDRIAKNKLLPVMVVLAVLAVVGVGAAVWGLVHVNLQQDEISSLKDQLATSDAMGIVEVSDSINNGSGDVASATALTKTDVLNSVPENLVLKDHKSLNSDAVRPRLAVNLSGGIEFTCNEDMTDSWIITIDWDKMNNWYMLGNGKTGRETLEDVTLGLSGEFTDVYFGRFGQTVGDETVIFLMKDGTVEYIPIQKALKENNLKSYGTLSGIEHVIKFYAVNNGGATILAQRVDGDYYNLYNAVQATGNY